MAHQRLKCLSAVLNWPNFWGLHDIKTALVKTFAVICTFHCQTSKEFTPKNFFSFWCHVVTCRRNKKRFCLSAFLSLDFLFNGPKFFHVSFEKILNLLNLWKWRNLFTAFMLSWWLTAIVVAMRWEIFFSFLLLSLYKAERGLLMTNFCLIYFVYRDYHSNWDAEDLKRKIWMKNWSLDLKFLMEILVKHWTNTKILLKHFRPTLEIFFFSHGSTLTNWSFFLSFCWNMRREIFFCFYSRKRCGMNFLFIERNLLWCVMWFFRAKNEKSRVDGSLKQWNEKFLNFLII